MKARATAIADVLEIEVDPHADDRGLFARTFDDAFFAELGIVHEWPQCNTSFNLHRGTLRGMHYQVEPYAEAKLVRCTRGAAFDVAIDLRAGSPTRLKWAAVELSAERRSAIYIPPGFAHGFLTLEPETELFYHMGARYQAQSSDGVRWDDPAFGIEWPFQPEHMAERDATYRDFTA
ncbi:MAG: dTDP-4-dehydrorhamnose 3,5-epimerase [Sphingomonadales bacterium]|nr:dTDP-4-dehydrorhamnose 3,5-epimerase [Sphingomonadales bacterium]